MINHSAIRHSLATLPLVAALAAALAACGGQPGPAAPSVAPSPAPAASSAVSSARSGATSSAADLLPAAGFPVTIENCGMTVTIAAPPKRAVTLNQGATEVVLALGLADRLAGTAYLDDSIPEKWRAAYDSVPVLSEKFPSREVFLAAEPDFAYASYATGFSAKAAGERAELAAAGIPTFVSPFSCGTPSSEPATWQRVWGEISDVAAAFGEPQRAQQLVADQQRTLDGITAARVGADRTVLWFDSGTTTPYVGAGSGGPQLILDAVGARNIFADASGGWADGSWETVIAANPDVIVLADASWSTAAEKIEYLTADPVLRDLDAVRSKRFVVVPFSETTPGARLIDGAAAVAADLQSPGIAD